MDGIKTETYFFLSATINQANSVLLMGKYESYETIKIFVVLGSGAGLTQTL